MNPDTLVQMVQKGFRVTLGATTSLVESLQDPQKVNETINRFQTDFPGLTEEWAEKGEATEQQARSLVESMFNSASAPSASGTPSAGRTSHPTTSPDIQADIQELTQQLAELRTELEKLRADGRSN